jgi:hypothetical protein
VGTRVLPFLKASYGGTGSSHVSIACLDAF